MTNKEIFEQYGSEEWVIEENLCFLMQEYKELVINGKWKRTNLVGFVKDFMKEETHVCVKYAEQSKMDTLENNVIDITDCVRTLNQNGYVQKKTACFTGHRPKQLAGYSDRGKYREFVQRLQAMLIPLIEQGFTRFISGGAQGVDQLAFWAVEGLKSQGYDIENIVYVPYEGQEMRWQSKGLFSRSEYQKMINKADQVIYIHKKGEVFSIYDALFERNHAMCNDSELIIGVYEGPDYLNDTGGTAECLRYADRIGLRKIMIRFAA